MAKRRVKKRTHVPPGKAGAQGTKNGAASMNRSPKSMVIRIGAGQIGSSMSQLAKDVRSMMEPDTASRLKERTKNRLKDYTVMTGPLGVTHLLLFSKSSNGNSNLRIALTPRGPTLNFRIENYSLCKDVIKALKRPRGLGKSHTTPPLLVMNNFMCSKEGEASEKIPKHLESLVTTVFQSLFPPISPQTTPLASIRRIMLLDRDRSSKKGQDESFTVNLRHYAITTKRIDLSKRIRRLNPKEFRGKERDKAVPNLGKLNDVADYLLGGGGGDAGFTSASETEMETDAEVEVLESTTRKVLNKKELQRAKEAGSKSARSSGSNVEKRAVKLVELGPRMKLKLMKVEEGLCGGRVMWHDYVTKTKEEAQKLDASWEKKRKEKELRRKIQKENVEKKKALKAKAPREGKDDEEDSDEVDDDDDWDSDDFIHGEEDEDEEMGEAEEGEA
ncbi:Ribosome biogenesis protein Ssf2 [Trichophyton interdigitale]|uniref:Ribosome biogenesis protein Ssf2 n=1 Tax=Trichophyton interdigitale TaxID=101480 RepID=A0A9P5CVA4_9EURO|nr:Ribosome biogenesis protein Ssf2 [Trichophyton interdigitale]KAF3894255.1 Ribosome biogenesis protein Ssf2 [Trichophyton interdigitale]KAG8207993.1 Ribosome biogenesis protein Ssf2 [Trichophyton interdigitale]